MPAASASKNPFIVLTYATAGLGHLRVTLALADAIPGNIPYTMLTTKDTWLTVVHGLMSNNALLRAISEHAQSGGEEDFIASAIRLSLKLSSAEARRALVRVVNAQQEKPSCLYIACSHFMLAEQLSAEKDRLAKELGIPVRLVVQVTDDTSQHAWYIANADSLVVPSPKVAAEFQQYIAEHHFKPTPIKVLPYPISPDLTAELTGTRINERLAQYRGELPLHLVAPVSGAGVGIPFLEKLVKYLFINDSSMKITVVGQYTPRLSQLMHSVNSYNFFMEMEHTNMSTVKRYNKIYKTNTIGLEVTKPSEQAFKVLTGRRTVGGSILLFTKPVGRQEYENLAYLERYHFIPSSKLIASLYELAAANGTLPGALKKAAELWRGLVLPKSSLLAANFIRWCHTSGLFAQMGKSPPSSEPELAPDGAAQFWKLVLG